MSVKVKVLSNGPLKIEGEFTLIGTDGSETLMGTEKPVALCRCGRSSNKPFCDATHKREGWCDTAAAVPSDVAPWTPPV